MSDRLDDTLVMKLIKLGSEESFGQHHTTSGTPRLNRSTSFYSPISKKLSPSSEHLALGWPLDIWSETPTSKQFSSRPDRSMSLTEAGALTFSKMKTNEVPPPPGFPPLNNPAALPSNRYKTELCRSFQENGSCKYGSKCQFAHGESELRGLHRHPKYKTEACRTFYNFGYCPYGARCHFIHEEKPALQHHNQAPTTNQPRLLRQSVSFAGFLASRSSPPPAVNDTLGFTRAPSVSPPPADLLSPVFSESGTQSMKNAFQFCHSRPSLSDIHNIPQIIEPPKSPCCVCGHGNNFANSLNKFYIKEDTTYVHQQILQRSPSEDSLSDRDSYSSTGSTSGSESPTFDGLGSKRLTVFERLSLSD
ncbi:mRNA decay activator protein ZFP36 [Anguilla anguilla]|uniref:mRNA decay activator protein ZFP36 n=1 Tax=Anguilla anguilla TaxID=7936 RepID=UPI0015AC78D1|nr:mRNA decay activator protein ZFP36 [Anguilla anguilla]